MEFQEFARQVQGEVGTLCGEGYRLKIENIEKNNGVIYRGMSIQKKGEDFVPVIYLDSYYESYESGQISLETVAKNIYETFVHNEMPVGLEETLNNFRNVKDKVVCHLVNFERNKALLEDIPWVPFCDLAIVFRVLLNEGSEGCMSSLIHHEHVKLWDTSVEELCRLAKENTPKLRPYVCCPLWDIIKEISGIPVMDSEETVPEEKGDYVLSNKSRIYGAAVVLYDNVLREISEKMGADLMILPSSVHEVIIIPYKESLILENLGEMVRGINQEVVPKEDWLSDNVYRYSRETGIVTVAFKTMAV